MGVDLVKHKEWYCQAQVQVPNPLSQQAPNLPKPLVQTESKQALRNSCELLRLRLQQHTRS